ncbi:hypothetical protein LSAT2_018636 [Lamellibrachia satsuma]|nr:hypothetical protein LSAT2_018636 [Lamellibrachia satsuma]
MAGSLVIAFASSFTALGAVLVAISFGSTHWVDTVVNRDEIRKRAEAYPDKTVVESLKSDLRYFTRYRGLFRTCFPGNETAYLMRCHFAFFAVTLLLSVVSAIIGGIGCYKESKTIVGITALFMFLSAVCIAGGMAFFHGYEYLEMNKIEVSEFPAKYLEESQHKDVDFVLQLLKDNSATSYGYSYILVLLAMPFDAIAFVLYTRAAYVTPASSSASKRQRVDRGDSFM